MSDDHDDAALTYPDQIACLSDDDLQQAYLTSGDSGDAWADALAHAFEERGIDI